MGGGERGRERARERERSREREVERESVCVCPTRATSTFDIQKCISCTRVRKNKVLPHHTHKSNNHNTTHNTTMGRVSRYKKPKAFNLGRASVAPKKKRGHKKMPHSARDTFGFNDHVTAEGDIGKMAVIKRAVGPDGLPLVPSVPGSKQSKKARRARKKGGKGRADTDDPVPNADVDEEELKQQLEEQGGGRIVFSLAESKVPTKQDTPSLRKLKKRQWRNRKERKKQDKLLKAYEDQIEHELGMSCFQRMACVHACLCCTCVHVGVDASL